MSERDEPVVGRRIFLILVLIIAAGVAGVVVVNKQHQEASRLAQVAEQQREQQRLEAAWNARLQLAQQLATSVDLNSDLVRCQVKDAQSKPLRATGDPRADLLLTVAEQPLIVLYAPGFNFTSERGMDSFEGVAGTFAGHFNIAFAQPGGGAICVFRWATEEGYGPNQPHFAAVIAALRRLADDPLLLPQAHRRIVVEGYSAGGNFAKWSVLSALEHPLAVADGAQAPGAPTTSLRLVMIATPHHGAPLAQIGPSAAEGISLGVGLAALITGDDKTASQAGAVLARAVELENSRGVQQLLPGNSGLESLDSALGAHASEIEFVNISSVDDDVVPAESSVWPYGWSVALKGLSHVDFKQLAAGSDYANALTVAYGEAAITGAAASPTG